MARHRSSQSGWVWTGTAIGLILATVGVAWGDHVSDSGQTVAANVWFDGVDVSGLSQTQLREVVEQRADEILATPVSVAAGEGTIQYRAGQVGFSYAIEQVVDDVLGARHRGDIARRALDWVASPLSAQSYGDRIEYDRDSAHAYLTADPRLELATPVEPVVELGDDNAFEVTPGEDGSTVDVAALISLLSDRDPSSGPISVEADLVSLPPLIDDDEATELADSLNALTTDSVEFLVGSAHAAIGSTLLRRQIDVGVIDGHFTVDFDAERLHTLLEGLIDEPVTDLVDPEIVVEEGIPVVVREGQPPLACCNRDSVMRAAEMIMAGAAGPLRVDPRPEDDTRWAAWASGEQVTEMVGGFTTRHACCQSRVTNIHRIADIVRGLYLLPGDSVSLNEYVGQRTREKGFVAAGAIRSGRLEDEVGGGVSQFATTIFNAAFFSGLDIPIYQAHSLYFSRYPFGREATISHPAPDLVLSNVTDYPVLIWTSYTGTSITVEMYSTPNVTVEELGQRVGRWGRCTHVETDRQRTFADGTVLVDTFEALYRPAEGIDCNGNPIPRY